MPVDRRLDGRVLEVQLGLLDVRFAPARRARPRPRRAPCVAVDLLRPGLRRPQSAPRLLLAGPRLRQPALGDADAELRLRRPASARSRPRPVAASAAATAASNCCCEISSFASRPLAAARRRAPPSSRWLRFALPRLRRHQPRPRRFDAVLGLGDRRLAPAPRRPARVDTLLVAVVEVIGTSLLRGEPPRFGVGQLGARRVDRDLVVARIDLDQHGARLDQLVVDDGDLAAPCRRRAPRSASRAHPPAHRRSIRGPRVAQSQTPDRHDGDDDDDER